LPVRIEERGLRAVSDLAIQVRIRYRRYSRPGEAHPRRLPDPPIERAAQTPPVIGLSWTAGSRS
jgi:hypothetical protein